MNSLKNSVQLIGNLGNAPEIVTLESSKKLAKFSLAVNESYKNANGEKVDNTNWFNVVAWGKSAELIEQLLNKGSQVAINGKLSSRSYEDKEGQKKYVTEIILNEFLLLDSRVDKSGEESVEGN